MGGCNFGNTGKGRSASEVFRALKEDAEYEHGHGGYTGTIAEKPGFHIIPQPSQSNLRAVLQHEIQGLQNSIQYAQQRLAKETNPDSGYAKQDKESIEKSQTKIRELEAKLASSEPIVADKEMLYAYSDWYENQHPNEKWGDAYCLVIKQPQEVKPIGKAKALTLAKAKWGETAEVVAKTERASKANGGKKTVRAYVNVVTKDTGWGVNERVPGGYKHTAKSASAPDEKTALGLLFAEDGEFYFFGCASS